MRDFASNRLMPSHPRLSKPFLCNGFHRKRPLRFQRARATRFTSLLELELKNDYAKMREGHPPSALEIHHRNMENHSTSDDLWAGRLRVKGIAPLHRGVRLAWVTAVCKTRDRHELPRMLTAALEERGLECVDEPEMRRIIGNQPPPTFLGPIADALQKVCDMQPVVLVNFESLILGNE